MESSDKIILDVSISYTLSNLKDKAIDTKKKSKENQSEKKKNKIINTEVGAEVRLNTSQDINAKKGPRYPEDEDEVDASGESVSSKLYQKNFLRKDDEPNNKKKRARKTVFLGPDAGPYSSSPLVVDKLFYTREKWYMFKTLKNRSATSDLIDGRLYCVFGEFTAPGGGSFSSNQYASGAGPSGSDALHCYFRGGNYISPIIVYPTLESPFQITKATDYKPIGIEGTFEFYFKMTQPGMLLTIDASDFGIDIEANRIQYYAVRDPDNNDIPLLTINRSHVYNTWTHVAITYVSGVWTWYLNGSVLATLTGLAGLRDFSPASILFYSSASGSLFLQGLKATNRLLYPAPFSPPPFIEL